MKFPILIHLLNNKAKHIVMSSDDLPREHYFKIVKTGINPVDVDSVIEVSYRRVQKETEPKEEIVDQSTQENNEPSDADIPLDGASDKGSPDIGGSGI